MSKRVKFNTLTHAIEVTPNVAYIRHEEQGTNLMITKTEIECVYAAFLAQGVGVDVEFIKQQANKFKEQE